MIRRCTVPILLALALIPSAFASTAKVNDFALVSDSGKPIGQASYSINHTMEGSYQVQSTYEYKIEVPALGAAGNRQRNFGRSAAGSLSVAPTAHGSANFTADYRETTLGRFLGGVTRNSGLQLTTSFEPNDSRLLVAISRKHLGKLLNTRNFTMPTPQYVLAPEYDPVALEVLVTTAIAHPHANGTYTLLVPPSAASGPDAEPRVLHVRLDPLPNVSGRLDGRPTPLRHFRMSSSEGKSQLYFDQNLHLMEADLGPLGVKYTRDHFALTPTSQAASR